MNYKVVIGLEIHVELNTSSKMFCRCSASYFGEKPNTHTCPVCLGLPGALPYSNQKAIEDCLKIGLALNCSLADFALFERKNYFYPDLPKGYQISQYRWPMCLNGQVEILGKNGPIKIRIRRVHQEEDTGKLFHIDNQTAIDFNRSGVPLVEIVTEPDFTDSEQVRDFARKMQQIFRYLGVSNADMERGDMRLEANVSVRPENQKALPPYRVELKNINSFRFMVSAIEYEKIRQIKELEQGKALTDETRGWDEDKKITFSQRSKEEAKDYRYFPDPDLPPQVFAQDLKNKLGQGMPELPKAKIERFSKEFDLSQYQAEALTDTRELADFFESAVKQGEQEKVSAKEIANYLINQKIDFQVITPKDVVAQLLERRQDVIESDEEITKLAQEAILKNLQAVEDYKKGKLASLGAILGFMMRETAGKLDAVKAQVILEKLLNP